MSTALSSPAIEFCTGRVMHRRLRPQAHQFSYPVCFVRVRADVLDAVRPPAISNALLAINGRGLFSVSRRDYGPRDGTSVTAWVAELLASAGIHQCDGEIILQSFPRVLGYVFNPISIWFCHDRAGQLRAAICEVNNTFGERHTYVVAHSDGRSLQPGDWLRANKVFHVSPFCEVRGHYRFRFEQSPTRAFAQIDYYDGHAADDTDKLIVTTMHGSPQAKPHLAALRAFVVAPLMAFAVMARIHWQAFRLWRLRVPFFAKPVPPLVNVTRSGE